MTKWTMCGLRTSFSKQCARLLCGAVYHTFYIMKTTDCKVTYVTPPHRIWQCALWLWMCYPSATTLVSVWDTQVFRKALTALTEPRTLWRRNTHFPLHTYIHYFAPGICTLRTTRGLHCSQGLQLCCSRLHNASRCLCHSLANSDMLPFRYCYRNITDAGLAPYMVSFEIWSHITIQSSLRTHRMPLHSFRHYRILQVWNIQSNLHTV